MPLAAIVLPDVRVAVPKASPLAMPAGATDNPSTAVPNASVLAMPLG